MVNLPKEFVRKFNLEAPKVQVKRRLVLLVYGEKAVGKTDLCLRTAPQPILFIDLDNNTEGLEDRYVGKDIIFKHVRIPCLLNQERDLAILKEIGELLKDSMNAGYFRTYVIDTATNLYELARRGLLGSLDFGDVPQSQYSLVNSFFYRIFTRAKETRSNLIVTSHMKEERKQVKTSQGKNTSVATGKMVIAGWKHIMEPVQMVVRLYKEDSEPVPDRYHLKVEHCNANPELEGVELSGNEIDFVTLGKLCFSPNGQDPEEWK